MKKAKIAVYPEFTVGNVDKRLFGSFIEHIGRAVYNGIYQPGSPFADEDGFRKDTLELVRETKVPIVRYPGGNFVSGYRWEDGIGPKEKRTPRLERAWASVEPNQVGLDEFCRWAEKAQTEVMMAVNLGTRGAEDAGNIVEYTNVKSGSYYSRLRCENGREEPYNIKLWCLGNEMDGEWQMGHKTAKEYGRTAAEAGRMMKMTDPSIELVACGSSSLTMPTFGAWEYEMLGECYDIVDYVSLHQYYGNQSNNYYDFLSNSAAMDEFIQKVISVCDAVGAKKKSRKKLMLSFDEWNVWYHSNEQRHNYQRWSVAPAILEDVYNLEDALLVGSMLITLMRHADRVKVGCLAQLVNVIAPILTSDTGAWRQTTFYPYAQASEFGRGTVLNTAVTSEKYESRNGDIPYLDSIAVDCGDYITVFAVNRCLDEEMLLEADFRAFGDRYVISHSVLTHDDIKAVNTEENPDNVKPISGDAAVKDGVLTAKLPSKSWNVIRLGKR